MGALQGVPNGRSGLPISHLLFADDSIFFARSDHRSVDALKETLSVYCQGSGQKINMDKSSIFFGLHCGDQVKQDVMSRMGVINEALQETYLGMPTGIGRSPTDSFQSIVGRAWKHMNGWSDRPASRSDFWWGVEGGKKKMHWRSWEWLSTPKHLGGFSKAGTSLIVNSGMHHN